MKSETTRQALAVLGLSGAVAVALILAVGVTQAGLAYVTTTGTSMEPRFMAGDIVVVRRAPSYRVGDVVAYRSDLLETIVLHRIVERHGDRLVTKGDNNDWLDSERPRVEDVIGRVWFRPPAWLRVPAGMRTRWPTPLATSAAAAVLAMSITSRRHRRRTGQSMKHRHRGITPRQPWPAKTFSSVAGTATIVLLAAVVVSAVAFTRPAIATTTEPVAVTHRGAFTYSAPAPTGGAYADGRVRTGDIVFLRLLSAVEVTFRHHVETDAASDIEAEATLHAEVGDTNGWRYRIDLGGPTHLDRGNGMLRATLDVRRVQAIVDDVAATTGVRTGQHAVDLVANVRVRGSVGGKAFDSTFEPRLEFQLDSLQLRPAWGAGDEGPSPLSPEHSTVVDVRRQTEARLGTFGLTVSVAAVRRAGLIACAVSASVAALSVLILRRRSDDEATAILSRYGQRIVTMVASTAEGPNAVMKVTSMTHLARLAHHYDCLILHHRGASADHFQFQLDRTVYRYTAARADHGTEQPDLRRTRTA